MPAWEAAPWQSLCRWLVNRLSFDDCPYLPRPFQGRQATRAEALWRFVQQQALWEDPQIASAIAASKDRVFLTCQALADGYAQEGEACVVFPDGIGVKAQKPTPQKVGQTRLENKAKRHETEVLQLPRPDGS